MRVWAREACLWAPGRPVSLTRSEQWFLVDDLTVSGNRVVEDVCHEQDGDIVQVEGGHVPGTVDHST